MRMRNHFLTAVGLAALSVGLALPAIAEVTEQDILNDAKTTGRRRHLRPRPQAQRFSPIKTLNRDNIKGLVRPGRSPSAARSSAARRARRWSRTACSTSPAPTHASTPSMRAPARRSGSTTPACPKASCPAATW